MMTREELTREAFEHGFDRICFVKPEKTEGALEELVSNPFAVMPNAATVILLIRKCTLPASGAAREAVISSYYPVSNEAYRQAKLLAGEISRSGEAAIANVQIPIKQYLLKNRIGVQGRNSLVYIAGLGSAFHVQTILTEARYEPDNALESLKSVCVDCDMCVRACPSGAIKHTGQVDRARCIRSVCESIPIPPSAKGLMKNHLLGCDICQMVCPMNSGVTRSAPLEVEVRKLLRGELEPLKQIIGVNYARKQKMAIKGCAICENMNRTDLTDELAALANGDKPAVAEAAQCALEKLKATDA